jgi:hypothetical protein
MVTAVVGRAWDPGDICGFVRSQAPSSHCPLAGPAKRRGRGGARAVAAPPCVPAARRRRRRAEHGCTRMAACRWQYMYLGSCMLIRIFPNFTLHHAVGTICVRAPSF